MKEWLQNISLQRQISGIYFFLRKSTLNKSHKRKESKILLLAGLLLPTIPPNYQQLPVSDTLIGWGSGSEGRLCLLQIKSTSN